MWHTIDTIALNSSLNVNTFKDFCLTVCSNDCDNEFIHSKDIMLVIARYRIAGFTE